MVCLHVVCEILLRNGSTRPDLQAQFWRQGEAIHIHPQVDERGLRREEVLKERFWSSPTDPKWRGRWSLYCIPWGTQLGDRTSCVDARYVWAIERGPIGLLMWGSIRTFVHSVDVR
jgi:hypothetical protein